MSNATATYTTNETNKCANFGTCYPFENICESGAYVCQWNGHLLRVPDDGVAAGRSPRINIVGTDPLYVTKIADNPFITITKARMLAANLDMHVNF